MCRISKSELFRTVGRREREKTKLCGAFRRGPGEKINFKERKQMSLNNTPSAERVHIAFFGRRNAGKSSLINAVTGQKLSIVSDIAGTTTDPVKKAMELLPIGPVVIIDTPGLDDEGELGRMRVETSYRAMDMADIAVLVIDSSKGKSDCDRAAEEELKKRNIPYITAWNKSDLADIESGENEIAVSAKDNLNIYELKELIARRIKPNENARRIIGDFIVPNDFIVLVVPIDAAAPKGRLILPQQQTIRDILDSHANAVVVQTEELAAALAKLGGLVRMVVTDSQAFAEVSKIVPENVPLTSFSILFARYKGDLRQNIEGAKTLDKLSDGDRILISEGCTHHRQCGDIGTVKLPRRIETYSGTKPSFTWTSGTEFCSDASAYRLIIHCGGCMLNEREMKSRLARAKSAKIPMTNYGIALAKMNGILERSIEVFDGDY